MRWRSLIGFFVVTVLVGAGGFVTGASAVSTSGWNNWLKFTSSSTQLCGHTRVSVNAWSSANYGEAVAHERTTGRSGSTCTTNHGRPAQRIRVYMTVFREDFKLGGDNAWNVSGGHVASIGNGFGASSGWCYRANAVGRQWSSVINGMYEPSSPTRSGFDCRTSST